MSKRVYFETVKKWRIRLGVPAISAVFLIFLYLQTLGLIKITGHSGDMICSGTIDDPCYAYVNFIPNEDIFIYPVGYDPWGRNTPMEFSEALKGWKVQRSWGSGWRNIPLDRACTGTWCGAPPKTKVAYSVVFRKGKEYKIRIVGYKKDAFQDVKWGFANLDPIWNGIGEYKKIEIAGRKYTPVAVTNFHIPLNITLYKNFAFQKSDFQRIIKRQIGNFNIESWGIDYLTNQTYTVTKSEIICNPWDEITGNGTVIHQNCTTNIWKENKWRYEWRPIPTSINIQANKSYIIDLWIKKKPSLGSSAVDIILKIKNFELSQMSWLNSSFDNYINHTVTEMSGNTLEYDYPHCLNRTQILDANQNISEIRIVDEDGNELDYAIYGDDGDVLFEDSEYLCYIKNMTNLGSFNISVFYNNNTPVGYANVSPTNILDGNWSEIFESNTTIGDWGCTPPGKCFVSSDEAHWGNGSYDFFDGPSAIKNFPKLNGSIEVDAWFFIPDGFYVFVCARNSTSGADIWCSVGDINTGWLDDWLYYNDSGQWMKLNAGKPLASVWQHTVVHADDFGKSNYTINDTRLGTNLAHNGNDPTTGLRIATSGTNGGYIDDIFYRAYPNPKVIKGTEQVNPLNLTLPSGTPKWILNVTSCTGSGCYQSGTYQPKNQTGLTSFFTLGNRGTKNIDIKVCLDGRLNDTTIWDTYVLNNTPNTNQGTLGILIVTNSTTEGEGRSWIKFSTTEASNHTTLNLYIESNTHASSHDFGFYNSSNSTWDEFKITWNDQPSTDINFKNITIAPGDDAVWKSIDITDEYKAARGNNKNVSIMIRVFGTEAGDLETNFCSSNYSYGSSGCTFLNTTPYTEIPYVPPCMQWFLSTNNTLEQSIDINITNNLCLGGSNVTIANNLAVGTEEELWSFLLFNTCEAGTRYEPEFWFEEV